MSHQPAVLSSAKPLRSLRLSGELIDAGDFTAEKQRSPRQRRDLLAAALIGIRRRYQRERRRRKVGRAYDMALEIAREIPRGSEVLDVGCGNGFIAHHLSALLGTAVVGIDVENSADAPIDYLRYDRAQFPAPDNSFDAVLLCYVLHHAQDISLMLREMRRVLRDGGTAIIYEDIPASWWDRFVCSIHNRQWKNRTGACTFRHESEWRRLFGSFGFEVVSERQLSRMRNLTHPVRRRLIILEALRTQSRAINAR
ncbi:MAG TPA: class I SAM-dependent methyltransferase [Pyrinomonadaceae bacterium]|nr:class I SAM-dependent methyltransferase [Pyrinomonadaceae bacterium]